MTIDHAKLKAFTNDTIRGWSPCYDPGILFPDENSKHTVLSILDDKRIPFGDKLWVVARTDLVSEKLLRLFAVWCARQVQPLMEDLRSIKALDAAEAFANGNATGEEWAAASDAAWAAARSNKNAAEAAAWATVEASASDAARSAASDAAWAVWGAREARAAQEKKLREMITAGIETGDVVLEAK